ncbi:MULTISPECIES: hypothetical protein [unclassified Polaromonas]|uniref:hypothetical protein n=1 Tax=unclassified Polaromonas TaxID=2638319 RepID=UPI0018CA6748|nr:MULTISPECIES: hypothetical protein [unclassified Polaromonas]MBG6072974.1 hypothetical protein [Polaromonas sp. CG_9.7]MBG6114876.1 hypothetical protein [Polaromonas sp. CG_9.2]MDH6183598.1 hypothetical protein [Polaromonas sp. CG_23.6]
MATAAGRDALPQFLETGFDAFAQMGRLEKVLPQVRQRESEWIRLLFDHGDVACATKLSHLLAADSMH